MILAPRAAYARWAPDYERETVVSLLERDAVHALGVATVGRRVLDAGCGTARRIAHVDAALRVGIDLTPEMLAHGARHESAGVSLAAADVRALPLGDATFDVVWCRLVLGHVRDIDAAYAELARVCAPGGAVVVTDFCVEASAAGHRRTFRDAGGDVHEIEHHVHDVDAHVAAGRRAGLALVASRVATVDESVRALYAVADRLDAYGSQRGLPLVLALAFRRGA